MLSLKVNYTASLRGALPLIVSYKTIIAAMVLNFDIAPGPDTTERTMRVKDAFVSYFNPEGKLWTDTVMDEGGVSRKSEGRVLLQTPGDRSLSWPSHV